MATVTSYVRGNSILTMIGGTATASTGDAALLSIQNINQPVLHFEMDSGNTITSINLFLRTAVSGNLTNYKKAITVS